MASTDIISINKLAFQAVVGRDQWGREAAQPLTVSLEFYLHPSTLLLAAASDDSRFSIRTWEIVANVTGIVQTQAPFSSGRNLSKALCLPLRKLDRGFAQDSLRAAKNSRNRVSLWQSQPFAVCILRPLHLRRNVGAILLASLELSWQPPARVTRQPS